MSLYDLEKNPESFNSWIDRKKRETADYICRNPDSLIPAFENELRQAGLEFEVTNQTLGFMPKQKKVVLPIAIKYYQLARELRKENEQNHFLCFFQFKGLEEVMPWLLEDYFSTDTPDLTRWYISNCFYQIRSKRFVEEYLNIISNRKFGGNRQLVILLLGKLKEERAIPILIDLLEDEEVRLHAISALGEFRRDDFRCFFERFLNSTHSGWRKCARVAIKKLDSKHASNC